MIDSHCHIDMPQFDADRDEVIARAREAGLVEMLVVGEVDEGEALRRSLRVAVADTSLHAAVRDVVEQRRAEEVQR